MRIRASEINIIPIEEAYDHLAKSIVIQAITDYREILKNGKLPKLSIKSYNKIEIEKFFMSDWYQLLTGFDGQRLIDILQEQENYHDATN